MNAQQQVARKTPQPKQAGQHTPKQGPQQAAPAVRKGSISSRVGKYVPYDNLQG